MIFLKIMISKEESLYLACDDLYNISVNCADILHNNPKILDLGAGTGLLCSFILKKYPKASLTLIDLSEKMLEVAKLRFKNFSNVTYLSEDYLNFNFDKKYDLIISALSIHHLPDDAKAKLFKNCYENLNSNGVFINADQVLGETPYVENFNKKVWKEAIENSGLSREELNSCYERIKLDKEATLQQQLIWFKEAGFSDTTCTYKQYHFAVMVGRKV